MKKHLIIFAISGILFSTMAQAQNTPIDDFLKIYPYREGVTNVSISQQMLQSIFTPPPSSKKVNQSNETHFFSGMPDDVSNVPEAYSSVSVLKAKNASYLIDRFRRTLLSGKYEQQMEVNNEESYLGSYLKKLDDHSNEIVVLRRRNDQISAIYIRGDIDINHVDRYLNRIRIALRRMEASAMIDGSNELAFFPNVAVPAPPAPPVSVFNKHFFDNDGAFRQNNEEGQMESVVKVIGVPRHPETIEEGQIESVIKVIRAPRLLETIEDN